MSLIIVKGYRGFEAICEHKQRILSLFRMMSTTRSKPVECFVQPNIAYKELQERLNPPKDAKKRSKFINS